MAYLILRVSEEDWNVLSETLLIDMGSGSFDPALRDEISHAFDGIECIGIEEDDDEPEE